MIYRQSDEDSIGYTELVSLTRAILMLYVTEVSYGECLVVGEILAVTGAPHSSLDLWLRNIFSRSGKMEAEPAILEILGNRPALCIMRLTLCLHIRFS